MRFNFKPTQIRINTNAVIAQLQKVMVSALSEAEEKYIELMREGLNQTSTAPDAWIRMVKGDLKHVREEITGDVVAFYTGVDYSPGEWQWMRAMVIAYGMGVLGLQGQKIYAGPYGREVWNSNLDGRTQSRVQNQREIPDSWYHSGGWFIQNATLNMRKFFLDSIPDAIRAPLAAAIQNNITVNKG